MSYKTEFPDFELGPGVEIPSAWEDQSWYNDVCPKFGVPPLVGDPEDEEYFLEVWVDYLDPAKREFGAGPRFLVTRLADNGRVGVLSTNSWDEVIRTVNVISHVPVVTISNCQDIEQELDDLAKEDK